jgi:hypothetical protein
MQSAGGEQLAVLVFDHHELLNLFKQADEVVVKQNFAFAWFTQRLDASHIARQCSTNAQLR